MGLAKLEKALQRGGVAERTADVGYRVWRCRNRKRRLLGTMPLKRGDALRADGILRLLPKETVLYGWSGSQKDPAPNSSPPVFSEKPKRKAPRDLLARAIDCAGDARERERLSDAACQLSADFASVGQPQSLTMNWAQLAQGRVDGNAPRREGVRSFSSAGAQRRLKTISEMLGEDCWQLLYWAFVCQFSCRQIASRLRLSPAATAGRLADTLWEVSKIYDNKVRRPIA